MRREVNRSDHQYPITILLLPTSNDHRLAGDSPSSLRCCDGRACAICHESRSKNGCSRGIACNGEREPSDLATNSGQGPRSQTGEPNAPTSQPRSGWRRLVSCLPSGKSAVSGDPSNAEGTYYVDLDRSEAAPTALFVPAVTQVVAEVKRQGPRPANLPRIMATLDQAQNS